jgi:3-deoxy-D-manno-octulosonate 8-phosphate phosphatase (KDO 8-P phosphatase)
MMDDMQDIAAKIKLVIFDIDGVMTDGSLFYDNKGQEYKAFNAKDGHGMRMLKDAGIEIAFITGRTSELVLHRAEDLGISPALIYQGYRDKRPALQALLKKTQLRPENIAYVGDDVIDLPIMVKVGLAIAVRDAHYFVRNHAHWITRNKGGKGAVREVCEHLLDSQGKLDEILESYLK